MSAALIRLAGRQDAARVSLALRSLSQDTNDTHRASDALIAAAGFGAHPAFLALLAEAGGAVVGLALCSPFMSTTRGKVGVYVSDLWVDQGQRGQGLGQRLLAAARDTARERWGATFLRLAVYADNPRAVAFYTRLGFIATEGEHWIALDGAALEALA